MKVIVGGLRPRKGIGKKKFFDNVIEELRRILPEFLADVKVSAQFRKSTITIETSSDLIDGWIFLKLTGVFRGFDGASFTFPERNNLKAVPV